LTQITFMGLHDPFVGGVETFLQVTGLRIMVEYLSPNNGFRLCGTKI
jgi:hypothetical protein